MKTLLTILFSCCIATISIAQEKKEIIPIPISYIRDVPSYARELMPAESKSLFWGKFSLNPDVTKNPELKRKQQLQGNYKPIPQVTPKGFHLYALYAPELKRKQHVINCHFALDIFQLEPTPKVINRVFITIKRYWPPTLFGMSFTWMDPKKPKYSHGSQTKPLIIIRNFSKGAYTSGIESFISFPDGWNKQASVTNLQFGSWHASDTGGEINDLIPGWRGLAEIHVSLSPATGELTPEQVDRDYKFTLTWDYDQEKFVPHAQNERLLQNYFTRLQQ